MCTITLLDRCDTRVQKPNGKEAMRGESNHLSRLVCTYQITADIQVLKSGFMYITNWACFSSFKKCQTSLKYSKLSSKFINYGVGGGGEEKPSLEPSRLIKKETPHPTRAQSEGGS